MKNKVFIFLVIFALTSFSQINSDVISFSLGNLPSANFGLNYQHKLRDKNTIGVCVESSLQQEPDQSTDFIIDYCHYFKKAFDGLSIFPLSGVSFQLANRTELPLMAGMSYRWAFPIKLTLSAGGAFGAVFRFNNWQYENTAFRFRGLIDIGYLFGE
jgi:hypothetical protein